MASHGPSVHDCEACVCVVEQVNSVLFEDPLTVSSEIHTHENLNHGRRDNIKQSVRGKNINCELYFLELLLSLAAGDPGAFLTRHDVAAQQLLSNPEACIHAPDNSLASISMLNHLDKESGHRKVLAMMK